MIRHRAAAFLTLSLVLLFAGRSASAAQAGGSPLPEEDPNFVAVLEALAQRADMYRSRALGFTCREVALTAKYDIETSSFKKSDREIFDYLFEEREGRLREVREELIENKNGVKRRGTDFDPPMPPAYAWASLFARENRNRFHFRPAGQVVKAYRLLTLIDFIGTAPNPGGDDISGWRGRVAVESNNLNIWSLEAEPSGQDVRLEVEILRYRKAFAIAGVPLASRPHGWTLEVTFGMEVRGLSYPTEQVLSMTSLARSQKMNVEEKTTLRYEDYRFFGVETTDDEIRDAETPSSLPNRP